MAAFEDVPDALRGENAVEKTLTIVTAKRDELLQMKDAGHMPTSEDLAALLSSATAEIGPLVRHLSPNVQRNLRRSFAGCGWDVGANRLMHATSAGAVLQTFEGMVRGLKQCLVAAPTPTPEERENLAKACMRLWDLDVNRAEHGTHYTIDLQAGKSFHDRRDAAADPLFVNVSQELLSRPTFRTFVALLDNYEMQVGVAEKVTREELREEQEFLNACLATPVMKYAHAYLVANRLAPADVNSFKQRLRKIWFDMYKRSRGRGDDSSGFEHVFIGEVKNGEVTGFHNWLQFYIEERKGHVDYKGYIRPRKRGGRYMAPQEEEHMITINFSWHGFEKQCSSTLIGVSPEFELALYTMCFLGGDEKTITRLGPYNVEVTCHKYNTRDGNLIGTSYPNTSRLTDDEAAAAIQSRVRGAQVRKHGAASYSKRQHERNRQHHAAAKLQSRYRGGRARHGSPTRN